MIGRLIKKLWVARCGACGHQWGDHWGTHWGHVSCIHGWDIRQGCRCQRAVPRLLRWAILLDLRLASAARRRARGGR